MTAPDPTKPWAGYIQDQQYTAFQDRMIQIGKVNHQATVSGLNTRNGVFLGGGDGNSNINLNVRSNGGMNLLVDAGSAIIDGYSVINPIQAALTVAASTATARRDAVILRVYDTEAGDATSKTQLEITKGTTTSDPPLPARSLLLAVIDVAANAVSVSPQDRRQFTTTVGGVVPYYGSRPDITTIANGQIVHSLNSMLNDQRDGDTYHPLGANLVGSWAYGYPDSEDVPAGVYAYKQFNITPNRQCNILVVFAQVIFHQLNQGQSSVIEFGVGLDAGGDIASTLLNTGSAHPYYPNPSHVLLGAVGNVAPGTHTVTIHIKPSVGDGIEVDQYYGWAIGIS
jgi:hypothetical protein